jgi:hypothetical protein
MTVMTGRPQGRVYPNSYASDGVGPDSAVSLYSNVIADDASVTLGVRESALFQSIVNARSEAESDDWEGQPVAQRAVDAAIHLLHALPKLLPPPTITAEPTGEIAFEWYTDRNHVVVLTVDGEFIRWSALAGPDSPISGAEPYTKTVPSIALDIVGAVVA